MKRRIPPLLAALPFAALLAGCTAAPYDGYYHDSGYGGAYYGGSYGTAYGYPDYGYPFGSRYSYYDRTDVHVVPVYPRFHDHDDDRDDWAKKRKHRHKDHAHDRDWDRRDWSDRRDDRHDWRDVRRRSRDVDLDERYAHDARDLAKHAQRRAEKLQEKAAHRAERYRIEAEDRMFRRRGESPR